MLKVQAFAEGVDKEMLGVLLILVNMMVLLTALAVMAVSFFRNQEVDYQSENPLAVLKREMSAAKKAAKNDEGGEKGAIELGEIYKVGGDSEFVNENPLLDFKKGARGADRSGFKKILKKKANQYHRDKRFPAPVMPRTSAGELEEPPPVPVVFTSAMPENDFL